MSCVSLLLTTACVATLGFVAAAGAQAPPSSPVEGTWTGAIVLPNGRLDLTVTLRRDAGGERSGTADIPAQGATGLALGAISVDGRMVSFRLLAAPGTPTFTGALSDDGRRIEGDFTQAGNTLRFELTRGGVPAAAAPAPAAAPPPLWPGEAVSLDTAGGVLHGTLRLPSGQGPHPVVLVIAGSGPTDRHGNSALLPGRNHSLALLAERLAEHGIATLRYDKRGVGDSRAAAPPEGEMRFEIGVDDAAAWTRQLREDPRFSTVTVLGHSEGSLVGMLAAGRAGADAFVSVAGVARRAPEVIRDQVRPQLPPELWEASERILEALDAGRTIDAVPPALAALYRPSVQPYLISWFRYNPAQEIGRLRIPVLVAQGTTDIQVPVAEAHALQAAHPDATLAIVEGMNHVLKLVPADPAQQQASYSDPTRPVAPALIEAVREFVLAVPRAPRIGHAAVICRTARCCGAPHQPKVQSW